MICVVDGNAFVPIILIDDGIETWVRDIHPMNALFPIDLIEFGITTYLRDVQLLNENRPIFVTDDGISICSSNLHFAKQ